MILWEEDDLQPRETGFRQPYLLIRQLPPIRSEIGDVVHLRQFVRVVEIDAHGVWVEQIFEDELLADPRYTIIGHE